MGNNLNKGTIYLSGGGNAKDSFFLDKHFINSLINKKVLYVPVAITRDKIGYEECYDWIINTLTSHSKDFVDITMWLDIKNKTLKDIIEYDAVYLGGGNTYKLLEEIYNTKFNQVIIKYLNKDKIIYGGSAGAIIMGKNIDTVIGENDKNYKYNSGLSLLGNYSVIGHYKKDDNGNIFNYISRYKNPVIALPEKSGIVIQNKIATVIGYEPVVIFLTDRTERKEMPDNNFNL